MRAIVFNEPCEALSQFTGAGTGHPTLKNFVRRPASTRQDDSTMKAALQSAG